MHSKYNRDMSHYPKITLSQSTSNYCFSYLVPPAIFFRKFLFRWKKMSGENMEKTELKEIPLLNDILKFIGYAEVRLSQYMPLPFGTSVYCVARKTDAAAIQ